MAAEPQRNADQIEFWNGEGGGRWVDEADRLERMLVPFTDLVMEAVGPLQGARALDVGCGAGALSLAAAAAGATVTGVDVSQPLLGLARDRAAAAGAAAQFFVADASSWSADAPVDAVISRFGVMFFDAPIEAFANLRAQAKPGARLAFVCWRAFSQNDWVRKPLEVVRPFLKEIPPKPEPHAPGPFAFADADHLRGVLEGAGWREVEITPQDGTLILPAQGAKDAAAFAVRMGPGGALVREQNLDVEPIVEALAKAFEPDVNDEGAVVSHAATWVVRAVA
ncbi:MAG: methyltransferase domain-containing protein [Pseudomonadota bacterium]